MTAEAASTAAVRAETLIDLGRHHEAVPLLEQALATRPDDVELLDLLAQAQLPIDARAAAETAARLVADSPQRPVGICWRRSPRSTSVGVSRRSLTPSARSSSPPGTRSHMPSWRSRWRREGLYVAAGR